MIPSKIPRILRLKEVIQAIGLSRSSIYRMMEQGTFPRPFKLGTAAIGWDLAEIEFWLTERKLAAIH